MDVFDRYDADNSVKIAERERRAGSTNALQAVPGDGRASCTPMEKVPRYPIQQAITTQLSS